RARRRGLRRAASELPADGRLPPLRLARRRVAARAAALRRALARDLRLGARHLRADRAREVRAVQSPRRHRGAVVRRREGAPAAGEPRRGGGGVRVRDAGRRGGAPLPGGSHAGAEAYFESGMLAAAQDYGIGGMQLPCAVEMAANSFFSKAGIGIGGAGMLTSGNANLLMAHGTPLQQEVFAKNEFAGRFSGTMCLSEPQAGSSLSDIVTRAVPDGADFASDPLGPRYRLRGNKMWISNGEHELTENIVHLVLAKIPDDDGKPVPGTRGISLFIVPKKLVGPDGRLTGERNDVALAGVNHKLGYRGIPNTLLNFGEGKFAVRGSGGAIGYLVGQPGQGLRCMFHMMNEARIAVGLGATMLGFAGYEASLEYAKSRPQGRPIGPGGKDASKPQVRIIEHADVKRMLLAQKSYCEGALALELYCAKLVDELHTGEDAA